MAMTVIAAYDVSNDDRRAQMAALLGNYGVRIQRSVFQCHLDQEEYELVVRRAEALLDLNLDVFHLIPTCDSCRSGRVEMGQVNRVMDELYWIV